MSLVPMIHNFMGIPRLVGNSYTGPRVAMGSSYDPFFMGTLDHDNMLTWRNFFFPFTTTGYFPIAIVITS
jgi:hypothetical protein